MKTKICTKCGRTLPLDSFHRHRKAKDGRDTRCRECVSVSKHGLEPEIIVEITDELDLPAWRPSAGIISLAEAAAICEKKMGFAISQSGLAGVAGPSGRYPHLGELKPSKTSSKLILAGINVNRWRGFLNGRPWARNARELLGEGL